MIIITYLIKQIAGLFHKLLLMVLFKHIQFVKVYTTSVTKRHRYLKAQYLRKIYISSLLHASPAEGKSIKAADGVSQALDRYVLALGFPNRKTNRLIEISLHPPRGQINHCTPLNTTYRKLSVLSPQGDKQSDGQEDKN